MARLRRFRVIPVLLLSNRKLVKTTKFRHEVYIGDPINALRIFNEKEVDEVVILDITAGDQPEPDIQFARHLLDECFMPVAFGGGIRTFEHARQLFAQGVEKVVIGAQAWHQPELISEIARHYGSQSVVVTVDFARDWLGRNRTFVNRGRDNTGISAIEFAKTMEQLGAGELMLQSIKRDGTESGYDIETTRMVSEAVSIPVVSLGGAGNLSHIAEVIQRGKASAAAAGSIFVFKGPHKAVLITYPSPENLREASLR